MITLSSFTHLSFSLPRIKYLVNSLNLKSGSYLADDDNIRTFVIVIVGTNINNPDEIFTLRKLYRCRHNYRYLCLCISELTFLNAANTSNIQKMDARILSNSYI